MSRARFDPYAKAERPAFSRLEPLEAEPGLAGRHATVLVTEPDPRVRTELRRILDAAVAIRPTLRANQAQTEKDGRYSPEVDAYFREHGFYSALSPQRWGGLELGVPAFFSMIAEVARGCPSTAWCLALSVGHNLTLSSYWPEEAQRELFTPSGHVVAPASGNPTVATVVPVEGGYRITGTWRYCSGSPYSTHFFPTITVPAQGDEPEYRAWAVVSREDYTVLDDWGAVIGMRGSGSNGITMTDVFVPSHHVVADTWTVEASEASVGYLIHENPTYAGVFLGFAEGEVAAVSSGLAYAALDEFERIIRTTIAPFREERGMRADYEDWRRVLGMAMARADAAQAALLQAGRNYEELSRGVAEGEAAFTPSLALRLNELYLVVEEMVWEAVQALIRAAGTGASADGQKMQRYFRDMWTTVSRTDQFEFFASPAMLAHFADEREQTAEVDANV